MKRSCVVIGGGISGMSAAILLARQGLAVTLVEKAPRLAPLVRGFSRQGLHFDTGFHHTGYLGPGEILDRAFRLMGMTELASFPFGPQNDPRVVVDAGPGEGYPMPSGFDRLLEVLGDCFPRERNALRVYLDAVRAAQDSSPYLAPGTSDRPSAPYPDATLAEVLDGLFCDIRLKSLLASQTLYHGVPPAEVPFVFHAWVGAAAMRSLRGVRGGGKRLVQAFECALDSAGVRVETGSGVDRITLSPAGAVSGVSLGDGRVLEAGVCLGTMHPALLAGLVPPGVFRPAYLNRLARLAETPRAAMVFGTIPGGRGGESGDSWLFLNGHDPARWLGERGGAEPGAMSVMISASLGGDGLVGMELAACCDPESSKLDARERMIGFFTRRLPSLSRDARFLDSASPSTFARYANSPFGSYYGPKHAIGAHPPRPRTRLPGFYLAGQAVVAPGIAGAVISACVAVDVLLGADYVLTELRQC